MIAVVAFPAADARPHRGPRLVSILTSRSNRVSAGPLRCCIPGRRLRRQRRWLRPAITTESAHIVSTVLLTDHRQLSTSIHPPDTEGRQTISIPDRDGLQRLTAADRLSFRIGLWLLKRSTRVRATAPSAIPDLDRRPIRETEAINLLVWGLQRNIL